MTEHGIPEETTPTWEMELLISGATVFGLLQHPSKLDQIFYDLLNRSSEDAGSLIVPLWLYAKTALITLIGTFIVHLFLRGYWIALVGLDSVYPGGIDPSRFRLGPVQHEVVSAQPPMRARIESADNRATRVFGVGFGLAMLMLAPFLLVLLCLAVVLVSEASDRGGLAIKVAIAGVVILQAPLLLSRLLDRNFAARVKRNGIVGRAMRGTFSLYQRLGMGGDTNPLLALFRSHESRWRTFAVIGSVLAVSGTLVVGQFLAESQSYSFGRFLGLPEESISASDVLMPQHYATTRGDQRSPVPSAFIPDKLVQGPYLELYIPYRPKTHAIAMRSQCAQPLEDLREGKPARASLDCLAQLLDIRIDGAKLSVSLDAATDPTSGLRAVLAMIPVSALAAGRHELTVARFPTRGAVEPPKPERIPFWK